MSGHRVLCVGEVLVDHVARRSGGDCSARVGGAPANVAVALRYLGSTVSLAGRVGRDWLGDEISASLAGHGVDVQRLQHDHARPTTAALVAPPGAVPDFLLYLTGTASAQLEATDELVGSVAAADLVHVGSLLMAGGASRATCRAVVAAAREAGGVVTTDVNLRPSAWASRQEMVEATVALVGSCDVVKATRTEVDELALDTADGRLWLVTDGAGDAFVQHGPLVVRGRPTPQPVVDSTGAGDAAFAGLLDAYLELRSGGEDVTARWAGHALQRALSAGSLAVSHVGAMEALPHLATLATTRRGEHG